MRWLRNQTIRSRITISSVLIGAVLIAIAAFGFRSSVDAIGASSTRALLGSDASPYEAVIDSTTTKKFPTPDEDQFIAVVDPNGHVRVTSLPVGLRQRLEELENLQRGTHVIRANGREYDVFNERVFGKAGEWHIIAARSRAGGDVILGSLDSAIIAGSIALVLGFGIASWIVTGLALRPVSRMRRQARELSTTANSGYLRVGSARDELSDLAETLNALIASVRASADRERQMVADASHELRTPIAVLTTQLQLAHLSTGDATALEGEIASAEQTLARLSALTTSLLTLSRIEAEDTEIPATTPLADLFSEFLAAMDRAVVLGSAASVSVDFAASGDDLPGEAAILVADFGRLVDNLVSNAIAASSRGSGVDARLDAAGQQITLTVSDVGHGIPAQFLPVAFDRFSRSETSRSHRQSGSGLGLAIVRAIVVRANGDVTLQPRSTGGVTATVSLPVKTLR